MFVGVYTFIFFGRLIREIPTISSSSGLLDHALIQEAYWFTRVSLFQAGTPDAVFYVAHGIGLLGAVALIVGYRVKGAALLLLVLEASTYRWNFMVMYLDDAVAHLVLFWLLLLPIGRTLVLWRGRVTPDDWKEWLEARVPAGPVLCMLLNVCLIYILAGFWKLDSPLWRDGFGLYASVKVHVAVRPDIWKPEHLPWLEFGNLSVLLLEPIIPLGMLLKPGKFLRYLSALAFFVFNAFIFATLGIRFAIAGLTLTLLLFLREEVHAGFVRWKGRDQGATLGVLTRGEFDGPDPMVVDSARDNASPTIPRLPRATRLSVAFLLVLTMATTRGVPWIGALNEPAYVALWMVGVAQDYRLFNWIDRVNWEVDSRLVIETNGSAAAPGTDTLLLEPPSSIYPNSFRAKLLRAYGHNVRWLTIPQAHHSQLINMVGVRQAAWHCAQADGPLRATLLSDMVRITRENIQRTDVTPFLFADYECTRDRSAAPDSPLRPRLLRGAIFLDSIPPEERPGLGAW